MAQVISIELEDKTYSGRTTDADALTFLGWILPNYFEVIKNERGLREEYDKFHRENSEALTAGTNTDEMYEKWGERFLIRITNNLDIRSAAAQRITEIFPTIPRTLVDYKRWTDSEGRRFDESLIRLDLDEIMSIVVAVSGALKSGSEVKTEADVVQAVASPNKTRGKGFKSSNELETLRTRVQELEAQQTEG